MNINDNDKYQLIDDFLSGGMSAKEIDSFKAFMQSDKDLAYDMKVVAEIEEASSFNILENQLKDTLANIRTERTVQKDQAKTETSKPQGLKYLVLALLTIGVLFLAYSIFTSQDNKSNQVIDYQQYAMVEPLQLTTKSELNIADFGAMQELYNAGSYREALPKLESYLIDYPRDLDVLLAKGIAFSELGEFEKAHTVFAKIKSMNPRVKKYQWYDALTYIKEGKLAEAKPLLEDLNKNKAYKFEQAQKLSASIN